MDRTLRSRLAYLHAGCVNSFCLFAGVFFFLFFFFSSTVSANPASSPELEGILRKIEARHYRWVAIRADVILFFATSGNSRAMCGGELVYQRLDERMLLTCVDSQRNLVFAFRTLDRRFDLYLPDQNTIYHGSIFDLEDSPEIESHLKPRDLYRALKPLAVDPRHTEIERNNSVVTNLNVYHKKSGGGDYVSRKLYLTPEGDVRGELYYNPEGRPVTEIQRYDFREIPAQESAFHSIIFPKKITILSPETKKGSALFFAKVKALDSIDRLEFLLRVPEGTREIFLEERTPLFAKQPSKPAAPPVPTKKEPLHQEKKDVLQKNAGPKIETKPVKLLEPPKEPAKDADLFVDERAPSNSASGNSPATSSGVSPTENADTTLDPSVAPSMDMEQPQKAKT